MMASTSVLHLPNLITVRRWHASDAEILSEIGNNRQIWLNLTDRFPYPYTLKASQEWIGLCNDPENWLPCKHAPTRKMVGNDQAAKEDDRQPKDFAVCHNNIPIGACGLESDPSKSPHTVSIGYWISEAYWGRGIATQVATAFADWAFDTFPWIVRVEADAYSWNKASQKVLQKAGLVYEGRQRLRVCRAGKFGDLLLYAKLRPGLEAVLMEPEGP